MGRKEIKLGPKDIVLPIMGPTGAGKSTFINIALGEDVTEVSGSTTSCTKQPLPIIIDPIPDHPELSGRRLVLLDTPGFDDTHLPDRKILKHIRKCLKHLQEQGAIVGGVLYLHDISAKRFAGAERHHLEMLSALCGPFGLQKTVIVTTHWPSGHDANLEARENEMKDEHWKSFIGKGLQVRRFHQDSSSAWGVIGAILIDDIKPLDLQFDMVLTSSSGFFRATRDFLSTGNWRKIFS